jgi:anti-anti-sigma factor
MKVILKIDEGDLSGLRMWDQFSEKLLRLVDAGFTEIVVDLGAVRTITSLALGTIVSTHQKMAAAGNRLAVANLNEDFRRVIERSGLLGNIPVE